MRMPGPALAFAMASLVAVVLSSCAANVGRPDPTQTVSSTPDTSMMAKPVSVDPAQLMTDLIAKLSCGSITVTKPDPSPTTKVCTLANGDQITIFTFVPLNEGKYIYYSAVGPVASRSGTGWTAMCGCPAPELAPLGGKAS